MNKRAHIRHAVSLMARLTSAGQGHRQCRVEDFCLGGVLVRFVDPGEDAGHPLQREQPVELTLSVDGNRGQREITLPARVARTLDDGAGLQFDDPNPADLLSLQNHVRSHREQSATAQASAPGVAPEPVLKSVREELHGALEARLEAFFNRLPDALRESAAQQQAHAGQQPWIEAGERLEEARVDIAREFLRRAQQPLDSLFNGQDPGQAMDLSSGEEQEGRLSLVDKEWFEDWLTLKVMASRAEGHFHEHLLPLQLRFDELLRTSLAARHNPLHPAVMCSAFGKTLKPLRLPRAIERRVLEVFDEHLISRLGPVYQRINESMAEAGVLPDLDVARYLSEHYGAHASEEPEESAEDDTEEPGQASPPDPPERGNEAAGTHQAVSSAFAQQHARAHEAYQMVRRIMGLAGGGAVGRGEDTAARGSAVAAPETVGHALEQLQQSAGADDVPLPEQLQQALAGALDSGQTPVLDNDVAAATEVIHHLFEGIVADPAISDRVRAAIKRLQVPFLRLLLTDDAVLREEDHPARQMLNRVAQLGVRNNMRLRDHEEVINRKVEQIVADFSGDISIFSETLDKLDELCRDQEKTQRRNIERVTEACEGQQKVLEARREVDRALEEHLGGRTVPRAVLALIDAGWRQLLVQVLLREGRASADWRGYLEVLDRMVASAETMPDQQQLSDLLASIKKGLARVDETQLQNQELVSELRRLLSVKVREQDGPPPVAELRQGMLAPGEQEDTELGERERRWRNRARRYQPGDWFHFHDADEDNQQVRLAWVAPDQQLFVFVNHQGMKIEEFSLDGFAEHLHHGRMEPIDSLDAPAVDRGLEAMVQRVYDQMSHQATHDELTGLLNRRELERRVRQRLEEGGVEQACLVHLDVDGFKVINNTAGPEAGDNLLRSLAELIRAEAPAVLTARLSADEFALWMEGFETEEALRSVEALRKRIEAERFSPGGPVQAVTLSCGLAELRGIGATVGSLMQAADAAHQSAKEAGGNRVLRYQADDEQMAQRDDLMAQAARLTRALDEDRLQLRCQRIESTRNDASAAPAYEVLIAVQGEDGQLVSPVELVQAAERYKRMNAVDRWVITHVLQWMHSHSWLVSTMDHVSINLSGQSLNDPELTRFLFEQFQQYPVPRERVCFEVTETTTITNLAEAADFIEALQELGCRFSLDDFGSGLASYGYLKQLPVDYIKIDGSFIRGLARDEADQALVRSINEMGHLMGKKTIAECVETDEIRRCLREIGVDYVQGFGVERPRMLSTLNDTAGEPTGT